jgi:hypothetical protein
MFAWSKATRLAAFATVAASIPLALTFVWVEVRSASPVQLGAIAVLGIALAFVGASLASQFHLERFRAGGRAAQLLVGAVGGLMFGLVAAGVGALAAEFSLWALLLWFLLGSFLAAAYSALLARHSRDA